MAWRLNLFDIILYRRGNDQEIRSVKVGFEVPESVCNECGAVERDLRGAQKEGGRR